MFEGEIRHSSGDKILSIVLLTIAVGNYVAWAAGLVSFESALMSIALMGACLASQGIL